jgi:hypothetical protein
MKAAVTYMVPVTVFVDTETNEVVRVLQENEGIFMPYDTKVWDESWDLVKDNILAQKAIDIAENAEWPVWDVA